MKLLRLLFVVVALLSVVPCFGKQIPLRGKWEKTKKSISIDLPMDASMEEGSEELVLNFYEDVGLVYVIVTSSTGEIYKERVDTGNISSLVISLNGRGESLLQITDGFNNVYGEFSIY